MSANRETLLRSFRRRFGRPASLIAEAPGRANLIGEHTDYNQGHVLPFAIDLTLALAAAPGGAGIRAYSLDYDEHDGFSLEDVKPQPDGGWRNYVRGVAWALAEAEHTPGGVDLAITGDLPIGAGLSSSAALEVATAAALAALSQASLQPRELALLAQRAENDYVGVECGAMDQLAAVYGREGHALLIDCRTLEVESLPLGLERGRVALVVVDSAVRRALTDSSYNQRRQECARAASALGVAALRDVTPDQLQARELDLPPTLYRRARHVVSEQERVQAAVDALRHENFEALGRLLFESHQSLRDDFQVSCPELDLLVELASGVEGVLGARLMGAGFGGSTLTLLRQDALDTFRRHVVETYRMRTGLPAEMYVVRAGRGLRVIDV